MDIIRYPGWFDLDTLNQNISAKTGGKMTINEVIRLNSQEFPDSLFLNSFGEKISWSEGNRVLNCIANGLTKAGLVKGDHVAVLCGDSKDFVLSYLGVLKAGGIVTPVNVRLATSFSEVEFIVGHSESKFFIIEEKYVDLAQKILASRSSKIDKVIVAGHNRPEGFVTLDELAGNASDTEPMVVLDGADQALQLYTSGTTGRPKGAMLSHYNCLAQMAQMCNIAGYTENDRVQNMLPFPHCGFICFSLSALYAGAGLNIIFPFEPKSSAIYAQDEKTTVLVCVPTMVISLLNSPGVRGLDFSHVRLFMYGSAPMPYAIIKTLNEIWPWIQLQNIFGMTECSAAISAMKNEHALTKIGGVGRAVPAGDIRVVDEEGRDVSVGTVGEIIYRGPNVMMGYAKDPGATCQAIADGWYRTGDLGSLDEENILKVMDRKKDMLIRGGENIYPAEVERVLYEHFAVKECAVIGVPDEKMGERTKAFIVLRDGYSASPEEITAFCRDKLATYKIPEIIEFTDELPKNAMGKLHKTVLRSWPKDKEYKLWEQRNR